MPCQLSSLKLISTLYQGFCILSIGQHIKYCAQPSSNALGSKPLRIHCCLHLNLKLRLNIQRRPRDHSNLFNLIFVPSILVYGFDHGAPSAFLFLQFWLSWIRLEGLGVFSVILSIPSSRAVIRGGPSSILFFFFLFPRSSLNWRDESDMWGRVCSASCGSLCVSLSSSR